VLQLIHVFNRIFLNVETSIASVRELLSHSDNDSTHNWLLDTTILSNVSGERFLSDEELSLDDEEARSRCDRDNQKCVRWKDNHAEYQL